MTTMQDVREALGRVKITGSQSHGSTSLEHHLGEAFAATSSFATVDLITAILEAEGLGADLEERRKIAEAVGWPVSYALHEKRSEGWRDGFAHCKAHVTERLFG